MTKKKKDSSGKDKQMTIYEYLQNLEEVSRRFSHQADDPPKGSLNIDAELRAALRDDLRHAKDVNGKDLSQLQVLAMMSDLTGENITDDMMYNWTAKHEHRFPCKFLPAFIIATGGQRRVFEVLSRKSGLFALPGPEALRAEIQRIDEEIKRKREEKQKRIIFLKEMEGGE